MYQIILHTFRCFFLYNIIGNQWLVLCIDIVCVCISVGICIYNNGESITIQSYPLQTYKISPFSF